MADINNFAEINENFDTVKTLLNSIRAQGILNTSDVDKLLSGINAKLEKINTEEDIDLIKIFLSELKQNLEERHSVLVSKFGAIESLFSNLLKNSSEMLKSSEVKELFDVVATNLSVFSREVVSQKESLTDIILRLDAIRSDDSQKKDIIKNIALLKPDLERLNNGFDSIVISLNDNFKTIVKTITSIDKTEHLDKFADALQSIEMSSNTVLSALQMLDKKTEQVESALIGLATKEDMSDTARKVVELTAQSHELNSTVSEFSDKFLKFDNLAEKIDASVSLIAGLKSVLEENNDKNTIAIVEQLNGLQNELIKISSDSSFEEFRKTFEVLYASLADKISTLDKPVIEKFEEFAQKFVTLNDANLTRVITDISNNADVLSVKLEQTQAEMANLYEKNFKTVFDVVSALKTVISQLDENSVSANNAIFSSITDRLTIFENSMRDSLDAQEKTVSMSSSQLLEQIDNIRNLSTVLDYKMDSSVVEIGNVKQEFADLKSAVDNVLSLDFVSAVKDLRIDLYASKQEIANSIESSSTDLGDKFTNDLYGKYELLISKLDSVEDELKTAQSDSLSGLKTILENISSSLVDVLSYVSEQNNSSIEEIDNKFIMLSNVVKENNINYLEGVRDIVDVIKNQVETNLRSIEGEAINRLDNLAKSVSENTLDLKNDIKYSYSKLLEVQDLYKEIKDIIGVNNESANGKFDNLMLNADALKSDIESKLAALKSTMLDKIAEFKNEFTVENADKISELKFSVENLYTNTSQEIDGVIEGLRKLIKDISSEEASARTATLAKILDNFVSLKELITKLDSRSSEELASKVDLILDDFATVKTVLEKVDENIDGDMTRQLSIIEGNFESLVSQITILFEKSDLALSDKINKEFLTVSDEMNKVLVDKLDSYKQVIEDTFKNLETKNLEQSTYLQERIADLNQAMKSVWLEQAEENNKQITLISDKLKTIINENIKLTAVDYKELRDKVTDLSIELEKNNLVLVEDLKAQVDDITKFIDSVFDVQAQEIKLMSEEQLKLLKTANSTINSINQVTQSNNELAENIKVLSNEQLDFARSASADLSALTQMCANNNILAERIDSSIKTQSEAVISKNTEVKNAVDDVNTLLKQTSGAVDVTRNDIALLAQSVASNKVMLSELSEEFSEKIGTIRALTAEISAGELQTMDTYATNLSEQVHIVKECVESCQDAVLNVLKSDISRLSQNVEKETDVIIAEIIEQFDLLKKSQDDDVVNLTSRIEDIVNAHIYNSIEDLKSYLDVKTDNSVLTAKLDNFKSEMSSSVETIIGDLSKLLGSGAFNTAISDFRVANEVLINSAVERFDAKIKEFISENSSAIKDINKYFEEKLAFFDNKFATTVVDKFEEIKLLSKESDDSLSEIKREISDIISKSEFTSNSISSKFDALFEKIDINNKSVESLEVAFDALRTQIQDKSSEEAWKNGLNEQLSALEELLNEQIDNLEDINDLCLNNLPDVTEISALLKHNVLMKIEALTEKVENQELGAGLEDELKTLKSDIITQILNIFNQVSFVAEEEEILDFIQEKHDELITILSHIVTTSDEISDVKDHVTVVDSKIENLKDDIGLINEKITAIMSSEGDIDYVYSLQDLEADIANLRLALNEMKENDRGQEFSDLIESTNDIYNLVESIKTELPTKQDFEGIAEDILSISTRTNKLILASDESYKNLQDNLQDFKLVINDLDERTRNFARESGIDRLDSKLNAINNMVVNGAKTNQVFNQIFEYLAEWVDNASVQINSISDRVETLDDIGQIKVMLADIKAKSEDNSESVELIEALGAVFDKQIKRISSIETKLDRVIVETTINNKENKIDMTPMETTLNKFLVAIDEKMQSQQDKIHSLEAQLKSVVELLDEKDTAQLTKKVGGMDRQIAKLNKSIEKIASHVVEK